MVNGVDEAIYTQAANAIGIEDAKTVTRCDCDNIPTQNTQLHSGVSSTNSTVSLPPEIQFYIFLSH